MDDKPMMTHTTPSAVEFEFNDDDTAARFARGERVETSPFTYIQAGEGVTRRVGNRVTVIADLIRVWTWR